MGEGPPDYARLGAHLDAEPSLQHVSVEAVTKILNELTVPLRAEREADWLAMAIRRALALGLPNFRNHPERAANADTKDELKRLAGLIESVRGQILARSDEADDRLWNHGWLYWARHEATNDEADLKVSRPPSYVRFEGAILELDWLTNFLNSAAMEIEPQNGPWRSAEYRKLRVQFALNLAPIFEAAFGRSVTANNFPNDPRHPDPTPFMDFYQRVVSLAFGEQVTPDLSGVIKEARKRHKKYPVRYPKDFLPGL